MSNSAVLQIRADARKISQARKRASFLGYSSLQEVMRVFLNSFAIGKVQPSVITTEKTEQFPDEYIKLGPKAKKRWKGILRDADKEKNMYSFKNPNEALDFLLSEDR